MERREFSKKLMSSLLSYALMNSLITSNAIAYKINPITNNWAKQLNEYCLDLKKEAVTIEEWRNLIERLYQQIELKEILEFINFNNLIKGFRFPDLGVDTKGVKFPKLEGLPEKTVFIKKVFGMKKERAIIPHGHSNMVSAHLIIRGFAINNLPFLLVLFPLYFVKNTRHSPAMPAFFALSKDSNADFTSVKNNFAKFGRLFFTNPLKGEMHLRHYDKIRIEENNMIIKPTVDKIINTGESSSISDDKDNVHWFIANSDTAFTFDVIMLNLKEKEYDIHNIDIFEKENLYNGNFSVPILDVETALKKYGKETHH